MDIMDITADQIRRFFDSMRDAKTDFHPAFEMHDAYPGRGDFNTHSKWDYQTLGSAIFVPMSVQLLAGQNNIAGRNDGRTVSLIFPDVDHSSDKARQITEAFRQKAGSANPVHPTIQLGGMYDRQFSIEMSSETFDSVFDAKPDPELEAHARELLESIDLHR